MKAFISRRDFLKAAGITAAAAALAGCSSSGGSASGSSAGGKTIKIGVFEPASGDNGAGGKQEVLGVEYANSLAPTVEIGGETYNVELVEVDNQSSTDKAVTAAQELVSKKVSIVLGSYQQWMRDPYTLLVNGDYKVSKNYTYDVTGATYHNTGIVRPTTDQDKWDYPSHYTVVPGFGAVAIEPFNGSTVLGGCDGVYYHCRRHKDGPTVRWLQPWPPYGARCIHLSTDAGDAYWSIGSSILLLPPVGVAV